jgi:hypothetical protein
MPIPERNLARADRRKNARELIELTTHNSHLRVHASALTVRLTVVAVIALAAILAIVR